MELVDAGARVDIVQEHERIKVAEHLTQVRRAEVHRQWRVEEGPHHFLGDVLPELSA